jgi:hypothetical protein
MKAPVKKPRKKAERELLRRFDACRASHKRRQDATGYTAVNEKSRETSIKAQGAITALVKTKPKTKAGILPLLRYVSACEKDRQGFDPDYHTLYLLPTLSAAIKSLPAK